MAEQVRPSRKPYGNVKYADPGYQADGKARYPIDTPEHVRAAWSYINQADNASKYSSADLAKVKGAIQRAMSRAGVHYENAVNDSETLKERRAKNEEKD